MPTRRTWWLCKNAQHLRQPNPRPCVCGAHCATWIGEDDKSNREYTLDCLDEDGQRYIVIHTDLMEAVVILGEQLGVEWEG